MPAFPPSKLTQTIQEAIESSGRSCLLISDNTSQPRKLIVSEQSGEEVSFWIYAWTLTHGGRPQLPNEYRIQMTSVASPLALNPHGYTLLIGYEPVLEMFAGFDLDKHRTFTTGSPSVQIDIGALREARQDGLAFVKKSNDEIAVGIRPDQLVDYGLHSETLHRQAAEDQTFELIKKAATLEEIAESAVAELNTEERKRIVRTVSHLSRSANFRDQVLRAYGNRCAITGIQLKLIDAAHILPVNAPGSSDDVRNGIALTPTYHRAYDRGLIYLDEDYHLKINSDKASELSALGFGGGLVDFEGTLGRILLPPDSQQRPDLQFIRKANQFRGINT